MLQEAAIVIVSLIILIFTFLKLGEYCKYLESEACRKEAESKLRSTTEAMNVFADGVLYDWNDKNNLDSSPEHAVSIRLTGNDSEKVTSVFNDFLVELLGKKCYDEHTISFDLSNPVPDLFAQLYTFFSRVKKHNKNAIAVVILKNISDLESARRAATLKDHLWLPYIKISNSPLEIISPNGVGFAFLGGGLADCATDDAEAVDFWNGWDKNMIGRVGIRGKICT